MSNKENVVSQFGKNAGKYVKSKGHAKGQDLTVLLEIVKENKNGHLLDIATGGGHVANTLAPLFEKVVALDLTPKMLEKAKEFIEGNGHTNVSFVQGDAESLPFHDKTFDTVSCRIAPHHFSHVERFAGEVYRVLKENGLFLLVDNVAPEIDEYDQFYNDVEKKRDPSHYRAYKKTEWISLLEQKGFRIESFSVFKKKFLFEVWCEMMALPEKDKTELNEYMISSSQDMIKFFSIDIKDNQVQSFQGEAMLLVARKERGGKLKPA
ncbi:class I SAM-dependent methyltransferase [Bacillus songklensis]|uniref:Class I SAM-dependent methyltransferase n=1 Tax=Bacillus songklensis TaxID=1069116 RepID=A0ABV8B440_9BACI